MARKATLHKLELHGKKMVDVIGLAQELGLSEFHVRHMARQAQIPAIKLGKRWWFDLEAAKLARPKLEDIVKSEYDDKYSNLSGI